MSHSAYPTLSSSLYTYAALLVHIKKCMVQDLAIYDTTLMSGLYACWNKLKKYLDQSTNNSDLYYYATGRLAMGMWPHWSKLIKITVLDPCYKRAPFEAEALQEFFDCS